MPVSDSIQQHHAGTDTTATHTIVLQDYAADDAFAPRVCREEDSPRITRDMTALSTGRVPYTEGIIPEPRMMLPGYDTGVMCLIIGIFLIISSNFRHYSTFLKNFAQDLWKVRGRQNVFTDHTVSETRVQASLTLLLCLCEGILVYSAISRSVPVGHIFAIIGLTSVLAAVYYLWQIVAYSTVGYVFATEESTTQWVKGFKASQSLLGIALVLPALIVLFNPGTAGAMIFIALADRKSVV